MDGFSDTYLRGQLQDRRQKLAVAVDQTQDKLVLGLLQEVDAALERLEQGSYGLCEICHDPIEKDRLMADPLIRFCLDHLTSEQQRALEQDLNLAAQVQAGLLPKSLVRAADWEISYHYEPAGLVSGDYCDIINLDGGKLFFLLGDISGKGVAASMLMAHLHAMFRTLIPLGLSLQDLLARVNRVFCESTLASSYATLVCGRAESNGRIELCNAGHCSPLLVGKEKVTRIEQGSLPLGLFCSGDFPSVSMHLLPGETLVLYSDGLSEARDPSGREYGEDRLLAVLGEARPSPSQSLIGACLEDLARFRSGAAKTDDLTLMVIRRMEARA